MSKTFKHDTGPQPTAYQGADVRVITKGDGSVTGSVTITYETADGTATADKRLSVTELPQDMQDCLDTLAGLLASAVEAEGYEKDPHTRRKQEREAEAQAEADRKAAEDKAKADAKAAEDAEKAEADAENEPAPADPEIPVVG